MKRDPLDWVKISKGQARLTDCWKPGNGFKTKEESLDSFTNSTVASSALPAYWWIVPWRLLLLEGMRRRIHRCWRSSGISPRCRWTTSLYSLKLRFLSMRMTPCTTKPRLPPVTLLQHQLSLLPDWLRKWQVTINKENPDIYQLPSATTWCQTLSLNESAFAWKLFVK